jgi:hypothetical protein
MSFASGAAGAGSAGPAGSLAFVPVVAPVVSAITPTPTDEEMVAIVVALELAWPRPVILLSAPSNGPSKAASWRWSGRWWAASRR